MPRAESLPSPREGLDSCLTLCQSTTQPHTQSCPMSLYVHMREEKGGEWMIVVDSEAVLYCIAGNFRVVQNLDKSASVKIKNAKIAASSASPSRVCGHYEN